MNKILVGSIKDWPANTPKVVYSNDHPIVVTHAENNFQALDGYCPHKGGPLYEGSVEGNVLTCPWHKWKVDVNTGKGVTNANTSIKTYPTQIENDQLYVLIGE